MDIINTLKTASNTEAIASHTEGGTSFTILVCKKSSRIKTMFNLLIELDASKQYEITLINLETYYSFPNIDSKNNNFGYSPDNAATWVDIDIPEGCYEIEDIDDYIQGRMKNNGHYDYITHQPKISLKPNVNILKSMLYIAPGYKVDLRPENSIRSVLGFNSQIYQYGYLESENIVNIIDISSVRVSNDIIGASYFNGRTDSIIYSFSPNVGPGFKIMQAPAKPVYLPITLDTISTMETKLTDQNERLLNLRREELSI